MVPNNSARLATMAETRFASSGVSLPSLTATSRSSSASAQSGGDRNGRREKLTGAPRRDGIALSISSRAALTSPSSVAASKSASKRASMFSATFLSKRSLARLVKVIVGDLGRPPLFLGAEPALSVWLGSLSLPVTYTEKLLPKRRRNMGQIL